MILEKDYWVYILLCNNGNYYTGYTTDMTRRYQEHSEGSLKCKYTRSFKPLGIAQCWKIADSKDKALKIERFIKKLCKEEKRQLILNPNKLVDIFPSSGLSFEIMGAGGQSSTPPDLGLKKMSDEQ